MIVAQKLLGGVHLSTFEGRLSLQKAIYLAQVCGVDLGYRYSWYVHGPYSPDLAETAFGYQERKRYFDQLVTEYALSAGSKRKLARTMTLIHGAAEASMVQSDWLELVASIHYLRHIAYLPGENRTTRGNILERLRKFGKGRFKPSEVALAWRSLGGVGLIRNKVIS